MGFEFNKTLNGSEPVTFDYYMTTGNAIVAGDAVEITTTGYIFAGSIGGAILGVAQNGATLNATPVAVILNKDAVYYNVADSDLSQVCVGLGFDLVTEGQIDASTGTTGQGQFMCIGWKPKPGDAATAGLFIIYEHRLDV